MSGRFHLALAWAAVAGLIAAMAWAFAILARLPTPDRSWQFLIFVLPLGILMVAMQPRNEDEQLLFFAGLGLPSSNRRRAPRSCFAPYRPKWLSWRYWSSPVGLAAAVLLLLSVVTVLLLTYVFYLAFLFALRRAAWLGNATALAFERDWLGVRGPVRPRAEAQLARLPGSR